MTPDKDILSSSSTKPPWLSFLEEEISASDEEPVIDSIGSVLKSLLLSPSETTAADAARLINAVHWEKMLPSDPLMRFLDDKGIGGFLGCLWELVFDIAKRIPYNDPGQDSLTQLILELRKLPPIQFKI